MIPVLDLPTSGPRSSLPRPARSRSLVAVVGCLTAGLALVEAGPSRRDVRAMLGDPAGWAESTGVEGALAQVAALGAWIALLWVALGGALVALSRLPGVVGSVASTTAEAVLPRVLRRAIEATLGLSLVAGAVGATLPAAAQTPAAIATTSTEAGPLERPFPSSASTPSTSPVTAPSPTAANASPTSVPPAPPAVAQPPTAVVPSAPTAVTVVPGDCLWHIAEEYLGDDPSDREIDRAWRRWYAANSETVGPDPGLIHPGQRLVPPPDAGLPSAPQDAGGTS